MFLLLRFEVVNVVLHVLEVFEALLVSVFEEFRLGLRLLHHFVADFFVFILFHLKLSLKRAIRLRHESLVHQVLQRKSQYYNE